MAEDESVQVVVAVVALAELFQAGSGRVPRGRLDAWLAPQLRLPEPTRKCLAIEVMALGNSWLRIRCPRTGEAVKQLFEVAAQLNRTADAVFDQGPEQDASLLATQRVRKAPKKLLRRGERPELAPRDFISGPRRI